MNKVKRSTFESKELIFKAPVETRITGEAGLSEEQVPAKTGFHSLSPAQKRFRVLFYLTAGLTGILIVQVIWQLAVITAGR